MKQTKKKTPPERGQPRKIVKRVEKVRKDLAKKKQAEDQEKLAQLWDEDICE